MEELKIEIVKFLSGLIDSREFESWLYSNEYINSNAESVGIVLDTLCIDYRSKRSKEELYSVFKSNFSLEEYLVLFIELKCEFLLKSNSIEGIVEYLNAIYRYYSWDNKYRLIESFYWILNDWECIGYTMVSEQDIINETVELAKKILDKFKKCSLDEKIELLIKGFPKEKVGVIEELEIINPLKSKSTYEDNKPKWYQFWKK